MSDSEEEIDPAVAGSSDDEEEPEGLTHLERGFEFMLTLIRSETPWRGNGSGEWAPQMLDDTLGDIDADRERGASRPTLE